MAGGDFWKRAVGLELTEAQQLAQQFFGASLVRQALMERVINGTTNQALVRTMMRLTVGQTDNTEFEDLVTSVASITDANAMLRVIKQQHVADFLFDGVCIGGPGARVPSNLFDAGEKLRQRVKARIALLGGTNSGSMAV